MKIKPNVSDSEIFSAYKIVVVRVLCAHQNNLYNLKNIYKHTILP